MGVDRVSVGSVEIVAVSDGVMRGPPAFFFAGIPPEMYTPALGDDLRDGMIDITFGSFLVRSLGKTILVDTGGGTKNPAYPGGRLLDNMRAAGVEPEAVDVVVNTHLHGDHVGTNCVERDGGYTPTFANAEYWIAREEWDFWTQPDLVASEGPHLTTDVVPLTDSPQLHLADGEAAITPEVSLLPTPGHTPGHRSLGVASGGESAVILGDIAHHPLHLERLWIASVDELPRVSRQTKRALAERLIEEQLLVAAGHFSSGSFGRLVRSNGRRAWEGL